MKKTEFEFKLTTPINHHKGGDSIACDTIILRAPSFNHRRNTIKLKQLFMRAVNTIQKNVASQDASKQKQQKTELDGTAVAGLLLMSDIDLMECIEQFKEIILKDNRPCAFIENEKLMTKMHFDQLSDDDLELMLGEYIANFLIPSWMEKMMNQ